MVVIAAVLGTTYLGNTFQSSNSFSNVLFELLAAGALSAVLVPTFVDLLRRGEARRVEEVAGGVLSLALVALGDRVAGRRRCSRRRSLGCSPPGWPIPPSPPTSGRWPPSCCGSSSPRCSSTPWGRWRPRLLHARSSFALTAIAPIGNTIVLVVSMVVFHAMAGSASGPRPEPGRARSAWRWAARWGWPRSSGIPAVGPPPGRLPVAARGATSGARPGGPPAAAAVGVGGAAALRHRDPADRRAHRVGRGGRWGGGLPAGDGRVPRALRHPRPADPHGGAAAAASDRRARATRPGMHELAALGGRRDGGRRRCRWPRSWSALAQPIDAGPGLRRGRPGRRSRAARRRRWLGWPSGIPVYGGFLLLDPGGLRDRRQPHAGPRRRSARRSSARPGWSSRASLVDGPGLPRRPSALAHSGGLRSWDTLWLAHRLRPAVGGLVGVGQLRPVVLAVGVGGVAWLAMRGLVARRPARDRGGGRGDRRHGARSSTSSACGRSAPCPGRAPAGFRPAGAAA